jgi:hypothetical protein
MAFTPTYGFIATLTAQVSSGAGLLPVDPAVASAFAITLGSNYTYASLSDGVNFEIVRINSVSGSNLVVVRGQDGTTASAFPSGACLRFIWNVEGIAAVVGALPAVTITGSGAAVVTNPSANTWNVSVPVPTITGVAPNITVTGAYPTWQISVTIPPGCC